MPKAAERDSVEQQGQDHSLWECPSDCWVSWEVTVPEELQEGKALTITAHLISGQAPSDPFSHTVLPVAPPGERCCLPLAGQEGQ